MSHKFTIAMATAIAFATGAAIAQTPTSRSDAPAVSAGAGAAAAASSQTMDLKGSYRSSKIVGLNVYNQANEKLGDINEIILDRNGKISAFIIGVGGFLGMGEHDIAVTPDKLKFVEEQLATASKDNRSTTTGSTATRDAKTVTQDWIPDHAVLNASKDQLKALPQFKYSDYN